MNCEPRRSFGNPTNDCLTELADFFSIYRSSWRIPSQVKGSDHNKSMKKHALFLLTAFWLPTGIGVSQSLETDVAPLVQSSCIGCHDGATETRLNFDSLGFDLTDRATFRQWELIFDRVSDGEMPPRTEDRPDEQLLETALGTLAKHLRETNVAAQEKYGRVPLRRLTRLEHDYTLRDLLFVDDELGKSLPEETNSAGFDTVGTTQDISPIHIRSYLEVADQALDAAINLGKRPPQKPVLVDYLNSPYLNKFHDRELRNGGSVTKKLDDAVAMFIDTDYLFRSDSGGFRVQLPGLYRITTEAYAYQVKRTVTLKIIFASEMGGGAKLLGAFDIEPNQSRTVEVTTFMRPGDYIYPSLVNEGGKGAVYGRIAVAGGAKNYQGPGIAIKSLHVAGPLTESWPPSSTQNLLTGVEINANIWRGHKIKLSRAPLEHVTDIVERIAPQAFRRPASKGEIESFVSLAEPAIEAGRDFIDVVRVPLRSILSLSAVLVPWRRTGSTRRLRLGDSIVVLSVEEHAGPGVV